VNEIPVVDLSELQSGGSARRGRVCDTLRESLCEIGFVRVVRHGIDEELIRRVYRHFERFFSEDEAARVACSGVGGGQRGFTPFGVEHARDHSPPDLKEFFHIGQEEPGEAGYPPNVWPVGQDALREDGLRLFRALERCSIELLEALAESFALPRNAFASMVVGGNSILRALHYPPVSDGAEAGSLRAAAHEDINLITLLCEATDAGLEIRRPGHPTGSGSAKGAGEEWLRVEVPPGEIVADSGDMLSRLTNDLIPATTHRVVNPEGFAHGHRYSLPFFAHPRPGCDLSVMEHFVSDERPCRHAPITAGGYLDERLREIGLVS
jgi:isopenicillin N synthase-like dioxygenase